MIAPMMPGKASVAFTPNLPSNDAKTVSLLFIYPLKSFLFSSGGLPAVPAPPPGSNASTRTPTAIPIAVKTEAIVISCSQNSVCIFSANEVFLSKTLAIVFLKLVI